MGRRHPNVDDDEIGPVLANEAQQLRPIARLTDKLVSGPLEQARNPRPKQDIVVCDDYAPAVRRTGFACHHGCSIPFVGPQSNASWEATRLPQLAVHGRISSRSSAGQRCPTRWAISCRSTNAATALATIAESQKPEGCSTRHV